MDEKYSREDVLATHLWLSMNVGDALDREVDPDPHITRYGDLIKEIAQSEPESPPTLEE